MATLRAQRTATVEDFIDASSSYGFSYESLCLLNLLEDEDVRLPVYNVLDDYIDEIIEQSDLCELNQDQFDKYSQNPKLLCSYLYNNPELDFIILRLNGICDPLDFTMRIVRLISKTTMNTILSQMYNANKKFIAEYNERNGVI